MSVVFSEDFNSGTLGSAVSYDTVSGSWVYDDTHSVSGLAALGDYGSGGYTALEKYFTALSEATSSVDLWCIPLTGGVESLMQHYSGSSLAAEIRVNSTGHLSIRDRYSTVATSTVTITAGQRFHLDWAVSSTQNIQRLDIYIGSNAGGSIPDESISGSYTQGAISRLITGLPAGDTPDNQKIWLDNVQVVDTYQPVPTGPTPGTYIHDGTGYNRYVPYEWDGTQWMEADVVTTT